MATSNSNNRRKVQPYVEHYTYFVLKNLIEVKGKSIGDVASFIFKDWIGDHQEELREMGITVRDWKESAKSDN